MVTVYRVRVAPFILHAAASQLCDAPLTSLRTSLGKASVCHGVISGNISWKDRELLYAHCRRYNVEFGTDVTQRHCLSYTPLTSLWRGKIA